MSIVVDPNGGAYNADSCHAKMQLRKIGDSREESYKKAEKKADELFEKIAEKADEAAGDLADAKQMGKAGAMWLGDKNSFTKEGIQKNLMLPPSAAGYLLGLIRQRKESSVIRAGDSGTSDTREDSGEAAIPGEETDAVT